MFCLILDALPVAGQVETRRFRGAFALSPGLQKVRFTSSFDIARDLIPYLLSNAGFNRLIVAFHTVTGTMTTILLKSISAK